MPAKPIKCSYALKQTGRFVCCGKLGGACGFRTSVEPTVCARCVAGKFNLAVLGEQTTPELWRLYKGLLNARLCGAFKPALQAANPVDANAAYAKFAPLATADEKKALLDRMIELHSEEQAADIVAFAERNALTAELLEVTSAEYGAGG